MTNCECGNYEYTGLKQCVLAHLVLDIILVILNCISNMNKCNAMQVLS